LPGEAYSVQRFLTDQDFLTLAKEVILALRDSAGEEGFGMDQQPGQVGIELARVHWLGEPLGRQHLHSVRLLPEPTGSQGGHSQGVISSGRSRAPEGLRAAAETAYFSS